MKTFARFLQLAYVTTDFDRALEEFRRSHGVARFLEMRGVPSPTTPGCFAELNVGLAWVGDMQIEVIAPLSGDDAVYRSALPAQGFAIRFHHVGQTVETPAELNRLREETRAADIHIPIETPDYFYADLRGQLGHHVEYIGPLESMGPEGLAILQRIPRN